MKIAELIKILKKMAATRSAVEEVMTSGTALSRTSYSKSHATPVKRQEQVSQTPF
jgi:hypothetical protein